MTIHFMPALWLDDGGLELSETIRITAKQPEIMCKTPRKLVINHERAVDHGGFFIEAAEDHARDGRGIGEGPRTVSTAIVAASRLGYRRCGQMAGKAIDVSSRLFASSIARR